MTYNKISDDSGMDLDILKRAFRLELSRAYATCGSTQRTQLFVDLISEQIRVVGDRGNHDCHLSSSRQVHFLLV